MSAVEDLDQERRITFCLYDLWDKLVGESGLPALKRMSQKDIAPFKKNLVLIDLRENEGQPTFQVIGQELQEDLEIDLSGQPVSEVPRRTMLSRVTDHYLEVLANRVPIAFEAEFVNRDSEKALYRGILLPFSDDNKNINFILGGVRWILEKDVQLEDGTPSIEELMKSISSGIEDRQSEQPDIAAEETSKPVNVDPSDGVGDAEKNEISDETTSDIDIATDQEIQDNKENWPSAESGLTDDNGGDVELEPEIDVEPVSDTSPLMKEEGLPGEGEEVGFDNISPDTSTVADASTEKAAEEGESFADTLAGVLESDAGETSGEDGLDTVGEEPPNTADEETAYLDIGADSGEDTSGPTVGTSTNQYVEVERKDDQAAETVDDDKINEIENSVTSTEVGSEDEDDIILVEDGESLEITESTDDNHGEDIPVTIEEDKLASTTDEALSAQEQTDFDKPDNETNEEVSAAHSPRIEENIISDELADEPQDSLTLEIEETHPFEEDIVNELTTDSLGGHVENNASGSEALSEDGLTTEPAIEEEASSPEMEDEDHTILTGEVDDKIIEISDAEDDIENTSPGKNIDEPAGDERSADETPEEISEDVIILPDETEDLYSGSDENVGPADEISLTNDVPITDAEDNDGAIDDDAMEEDEDELILEKELSEAPDRDDPFASRGAIIFDALAEEKAATKTDIAATPEEAIESEGLGPEEDGENEIPSQVSEQVNVEIGANEPSIEELMQSIIKNLDDSDREDNNDSEDNVVSEEDQTDSDALDDPAAGIEDIDSSTDVLAEASEEKEATDDALEIDEVDTGDFDIDLTYEDPVNTSDVTVETTIENDSFDPETIEIEPLVAEDQHIKPKRKSLIERAAEKEATQNTLSEIAETPAIETVAAKTPSQKVFQEKSSIVEPVAADMTGSKSALSLAQLQNELKQIIGYIKKEDANHNRSRDSLYNILTAIYKFHHTCQISVDAFKQLVAEDDLKIQARAPFTPVLKICLGKDYDKTRLTEYAAALGIAKHLGIEVDEFHSFIKNFPGGIKGCVQEMRSIRKHGTSATVFTHKNRTVEEAREILRNMTPIGQFRLKKMIVGQNMDEFCLLLAKRDGHAIEVLKVLDDKYTKLEPILKRTAFIKGNLNESK